MKKYLKYINGVISFSTLLYLLFDFLVIAGFSLSAVDILKIGTGFSSQQELVKKVLQYVQTYIQRITILLIVIIVVSVLGGILSCILKDQIAFISVIPCAFVGFISIFMGYHGLKENVEAMNDAVNFFGAKNIVSINHTVFVCWMLTYVVLALISVAGLCLCKNKQNITGDIFLEDINIYPVIEEGDHKMDDVQREKPVFQGALLGKNRSYVGKAYPLLEKTRVFLLEDQCEIVVSKYEDTNALAAIYYVSEYQEYCVEVRAARSIYLKSGQPLGKGRTYYLPRGMEIYVKSEENMFGLA